MPREYTFSSPSRKTYRQLATRPLNCLLFLLPLLLFFHVGIAFYKTQQLLAPRDLGLLLSFFGATAAYLPALCVVAVLVGQHIASRDPWRFNGKVLAGIALESVLWMLPMIAMCLMAGRLLQATEPAAMPMNHVMPKLLVAVGAGIYEEFIFRLLFIGLAMLVLVDTFKLKKDVILAIAVIVSGICFSLYHFTGAQIQGAGGFPWRDFSFRAVAGVYLGGVYALRGFGIAVGTHAAFDIYAVLLQSA